GLSVSAEARSRVARRRPAILPAPQHPGGPGSMAKARTAYVCTECGADFSKWQGQCGACGAWDTVSEIVLESAASAKAAAPARRGGWAGRVDAPKVTPLKDVCQADEVRVGTGIGEFDRVLGDRKSTRLNSSHVKISYA